MRVQANGERRFSNVERIYSYPFVISVYNYIRKSKFRVVCSPSFKLNRINQDNIPTLSLRDVIGFMKRFEDARAIDVLYENYTTY